MENEIIQIIAKIIKKQPEELMATLDAPEMWDSMMHIEIVMALEEKFDITFDDDEIPQMKSVQKVIDIVKSKKGA